MPKRMTSLYGRWYPTSIQTLNVYITSLKDLKMFGYFYEGLFEQVMQRIITCSPVFVFSCFQTRKDIADSLQIHVGFYTYLNNIFENGMNSYSPTLALPCGFLSSMSHDSIVLFVRHSPCIMKVLHV